MTVTQTVEAFASRTMYGGAGVAGGSLGVCILGLSKDQWTLLFAALGALAAVGGFVVSWYYKQKHYELALLRARPDPEA